VLATDLLVLVFGVASVGTATAQTNDIGSCTTINESNAPGDGLVNLTSDITDSGAPSCINIMVSGITLDGNANTVGGVSNAGSVGVNVSNSSTPLTDVTLRNLTVTQWGNGNLSRSQDTVFRDVNASNNTATGVRIEARNNTVENSTANRNGLNGVGLCSENNTLRNVVARENGGALPGYQGVVVRGSGGNTIENVTAVGGRNDADGVIVVSAHRTTPSAR